MKKLILSLLMSATLSASTLSMSDLQILVNEDIIDYFSLISLTEPIEWDDISKQSIIPSNSKENFQVSSLVQVTSYDPERIGAYLADYICKTKLKDNGIQWQAVETKCSPTEESENTPQSL